MTTNNNSEIETLNIICKQAKVTGKLSGENINELYELFGQRFTKALDALKGNRVKKYRFKPSMRVVWIVIGRERDYLIMPEAEYCTCDDFYFRVLDKKIHMCYHVFAQKIAQNLGWFETINTTDENYELCMKKWKKMPEKFDKKQQVV